MKKFKVDFNLSAWVTNLEVEANNSKEAMEKLLNMSIEDILEEGCIKDYEVNDIDSELIDAEYIISLKDIEYDIDEFDAKEENTTIEKLKESLPKTLIIKTQWALNDNIEDLIESEVLYLTKYSPLTYKYKILNKDE